MKLLLIMPNFFDYPKLISNELNRLGYSVDFYDDRPSTNPFIKAIIRVNKNFINWYIQKYFDSIKRNISYKTYDIVFIISGQSLSFDEEMMDELRKLQPQARFILYQWDSLKNFPYIKRMEKFFDECYTFDRSDAENYKRLKFLPLFYNRQYEEIGKINPIDYKYDFCFVGTAHPKKYKFITEMSKKLMPVYPKQFIYFYYPSRIVYFYRKLMNPELKKAKIGDFNYVPISRENMQMVYQKSKCILDSPQEGQQGLTIRVLEALGAKKKIITTNADIVNYDFYCPENIYVYQGEFDFNAPFFKEPFKEIDQDIYQKYALRNWLKEILK